MTHSLVSCVMACLHMGQNVGDPTNTTNMDVDLEESQLLKNGHFKIKLLILLSF